MNAPYNRRFSPGKLSPEMLATIRDRWQGKLVLKGLATTEDAGAAVLGRAGGPSYCRQS